MSRKALEIKVSERTLSLILKELNKKKLAVDYTKRLQIIYYSSLGHYNKDIAELLDCTVATIRKWRSRWHAQEDKFLCLEKGYTNEKINDRKLMQEVNLVLSDAARTGSPIRLINSEKIRLQALACESPRDYDLPFNSWTHVSLAEQAAKMGIRISASYYGTLLKKRITAS